MEQVIALLLASPAVTALVGNRIRPVRAGQNDAAPYVVIHRVSDQRGYTYQGSDGLGDLYLQANCIAASYGAAAHIAAAIVNALDGYRGRAIQAIFIENAGRELATADAGDVTQLIGIALDFRVRLSA